MILPAVVAQISVRLNELDIPSGRLTDGSIASLLRFVFGIAGGIALLTVAYGGFKYVISQGNPQETAKAKDTILFALIGMVICISAVAIISFAVENL